MRYILLFTFLFISFTTSAQFAEFPNVIDFAGLKDTTYVLSSNAVKGVPELRYNNNNDGASEGNTAIVIRNNQLGLATNVGARDSLIFTYNLSHLSVDSDSLKFKFEYQIANIFAKPSVQLLMRGDRSSNFITIGTYTAKGAAIETDYLNKKLKASGQSFSENFELIVVSYINYGSYGLTPKFYFDNFELEIQPEYELKTEEIIVESASSTLADEILQIKIVNVGKLPISNIPVGFFLTSSTDSLLVEEMIYNAIAPNDTILYQFLAPLTFQDFGKYNIKVFNKYADTYASNDTIKQNLFKIEPKQTGLPFIEDFESLGVESNNKSIDTSSYFNNYAFDLNSGSIYYYFAPRRIRSNKYGPAAFDINLTKNGNFDFIGALDLSAYDASVDDVFLDLYYYISMRYTEITVSEGTKLFIRGNDREKWLLVNDYSDSTALETKLSNNNISKILNDNNQNFSNTFQFKFRTENGTSYKAFAVDGLSIYKNPNEDPLLNNLTTSPVSSISKKDSVQLQLVNNGLNPLQDFSVRLRQILIGSEIYNNVADTTEIIYNFQKEILSKDTLNLKLPPLEMERAGSYSLFFEVITANDELLFNNTFTTSTIQLGRYTGEEMYVNNFNGKSFTKNFNGPLPNEQGLSLYQDNYDTRRLYIDSENLIRLQRVSNLHRDLHLLLSIDLEQYKGSPNPINLEFDLRAIDVVQGDSSKVYARGSEDDEWFVIFDWLEKRPADDSWMELRYINLADSLALHNQELSATTQIRFSHSVRGSLSNEEILEIDNIKVYEQLENDIKMLAEDQKNFYFSSTEDLELRFTNLGETVQVYFPITVQIDGPNGLQTFETSYNGELFKGDTSSINITNRFDFSTPGEYNVTLISELNDDNNQKNDTAQYIIHGVDRYQGSLPYIESFENVDQDTIRSFANNISGAKGWSFKAFDVNYPDNDLISLNQEGAVILNREYPERGKVLDFQNTFNPDIENYAVSEATLIVDLSECDTTNSNILLSFDYLLDTDGAKYGEIYRAGFNRLYLRTKRTDDWVEVYNWYDWSHFSNDWVSVNELSISEILKENKLNFTEGMEFKFSQLNFDTEQFLLDNIQIYEGFSGLSGASAFTINNNNYVVGGQAGSGNLNPFTYQYLANSDSFERKVLFPGIPRRDAVSFVIDSTAYLGFGSDLAYNALSDLYKFTEANGWEKLSDFPGPPRARAISFVIDDEAYIGLGSNANGSLNDLWKYNAQTDSWNQLADVPFDGRASAYATVINGKAYVGGGVDFVNGSSFQYSDMQEFDPATGTWTEKIYADGINLSVNNATAFVLYNKMYIAYGSKDNIIEYNPETNEITNLGDTLHFGDRRNAPISFIASDSSAFVGLGNYGVFDPVYELGMKEFIIPNELPLSITLSNNQLEENTNNRVLLGKLSTDDPDQEKNHTYSIVSQNETIQLDIQSDSLFVQGNFNFEEKNLYEFTIKSTDQRNGSIQKDFQLMINDLNEAPTSLHLSDSIVWETLNQILVGELSAADPDAGESLRFELLPESSTNNNQYFSIQQNELFIDISNDGYQPQLIVDLQVIDSKGLSLSISKTIKINERVLELTNNQVSETFDTAYVAAISFSNEETTGSVSFQLIENDTLDHDKFFIVNGELFAKGISIYESDLLKTGIRVNDEGTLKVDRYFDIEVKDVNFQPVQILLSSQELDVNSEIGTIVGILSTVDPDSTDSHTYEVIDNDFFSVDVDKLVTASVFESLDPVEIIIRSSDQDGEFIDQSFMIDLTGEIENVLSNSKSLSKSIKVFPNPTNGLINVNSTIPILKLQLFDATGKLIKRFHNEEVIELINIESGIYHLQITTKEGIVFKQVLFKD